MSQTTFVSCAMAGAATAIDAVPPTAELKKVRLFMV